MHNFFYDVWCEYVIDRAVLKISFSARIVSISAIFTMFFRFVINDRHSVGLQ